MISLEKNFISCGKLKNNATPKDVYILIFEICYLVRKKGLADIFKLRILRWADDAGLYE